MATIGDIIGSAMILTVGDPIFVGLLLVGCIMGILLVNNVRGSVLGMILIPTSILAAVFAPVLRIPIMFICAVLIVLAITKFINR